MDGCMRSHTRATDAIGHVRGRPLRGDRYAVHPVRRRRAGARGPARRARGGREEGARGRAYPAVQELRWRVREQPRVREPRRPRYARSLARSYCLLCDVPLQPVDDNDVFFSDNFLNSVRVRRDAGDPGQAGRGGCGDAGVVAGGAAAAQRRPQREAREARGCVLQLLGALLAVDPEQTGLDRRREADGVYPLSAGRFGSVSFFILPLLYSMRLTALFRTRKAAGSATGQKTWRTSSTRCSAWLVRPAYILSHSSKPTAIYRTFAAWIRGAGGPGPSVLHAGEAYGEDGAQERVEGIGKAELIACYTVYNL